VLVRVEQLIATLAVHEILFQQSRSRGPTECCAPWRELSTRNLPSQHRCFQCVGALLRIRLLHSDFPSCRLSFPHFPALLLAFRKVFVSIPE
jgi:hypothetical protein